MVQRNQERKESVVAQALQAKPEKRKYVTTQTEALTCQSKVVKTNRVDLADGIRLLEKVGNEAELQLEKRRIPEEEVRQSIEQHVNSWEPTEKTTDSVSEMLGK